MNKISGTVTYGCDTAPPPDLQRMNPWTAVLRYGRRRMTTPFYTGEGLAGVPHLADILECLVSDSIGFDIAASFSDWCGEYGYNPDSRKAVQTWRLVRRQSLRLHRLLGDDYETVCQLVGEGNASTICVEAIGAGPRGLTDG